MDIKRLFTVSHVKGRRNYLDSQKKYEITRTVVYFALSIAVFAAGFITTGTRNNLLTIVAVLGCLPASKSLVETVMYCRYRSLPAEDADEIEGHTAGILSFFDMVFTTREKTYPVGHIAVRGNVVVGYLPLCKGKLSENACEEHIAACLKADRYTGVTVKLFKELKKYTERLDQMAELPDDNALSAGIAETLKSIAL